jgi:hypothetical protein
MKSLSLYLIYKSVPIQVKIASCLLVLFFAASAHAESTNLLSNSSFEEIDSQGNPLGWKFHYSNGSVANGGCVTDGKAGEDTHSGVASLQFSFPENSNIDQAAWAADPKFVGIEVEPGHYTCSFWIKAKDMIDEFHVTVGISGFGSDNAYIKLITHSAYLWANDFPDDDWLRVTFPIEIPSEGGVARIAPNVGFKTSKAGTVSPVPATTRILVDDIEIIKD